MKLSQRAGSTRRQVLVGTSAGLLAATLPIRSFGATAPAREFRLVTQASQIPLIGADKPQTFVWGYNGFVPGPAIRARQGERIRVTVANQLADPTTVHWHGIRVPNAMDGVGDLTQEPIAPGDEFTYEFDLRDAGTYVYHSHTLGNVQVPMGLFGPLIVEERERSEFDRDLTWTLSDWLLTRDGQIAANFGNMMDAGTAGRIGNYVTINARPPEPLPVRARERIRLRILNIASARFFALTFEGHRPLVIAYDGQPAETHELPGGRLILGPGMRADLAIDMIGEPNARYAVRDSFYSNASYRLTELVYGKDKARPARSATPSLPPNALPEPNLDNAQRHDIAFAGGMMGGMMGGGGMMRGRGGMMGMSWTVNGVAATTQGMPPFLTLDLGRSYVLTLRNDTAWYHPIHLHGHAFRVVARNASPTPLREWRDTVILAPRETVDIALVADNPGDWLFHCHILDHMEAGMMGVIRVA